MSRSTKKEWDDKGTTMKYPTGWKKPYLGSKIKNRRVFGGGGTAG